ncbi:M56 family metallopeptidase [Streptomyces sp. NPDC000151]|uniref:M56 family metallopeptidase n=1 Tax=Streptomyces sp. NPDC000151 TaxID=3154244 RepID=UPI00331D59EE
MRIDVYVPLVLSLLLATAGPALARRLVPATAARVLTCAAAVTAAASTWALLLLAATLVGDPPPGGAAPRPHGLHIADPVPEAIALAALAGLTAGLVRLYRTLRTHRRTREALRRIDAAHDADTELIVAASPDPRAFAIPGRPGRIFVTSGMLAGLDADERQVLLAHERGHLRHRHARLRLLVDVAAALNPLLAPVRDAVAFLLERWADEHAADRTGDRRDVARALARAALLAHRGGGTGCALRFSGLAISRRVAALQAAPPSTTRVLAVAFAGLAALPALGALGAADATDDFLTLLPHLLT